MAEYIDRETVIDLITKRYENPEICTQEINRIPALDVAPVVHGVPISKNRPQKYEMYEETGTGENGETLYRKRIYVDEKNSVEYCSACGKRLCSRFRSFCPNCGARIDGE